MENKQLNSFMGKRILAILMVLCCVCLSACKNTSTFKTDKLKVCTSFYTVYDFVQKIGGEKIEIINLVPAGVEPHDWEPNPKDLVILEKADVLMCNGLGMEAWLSKIKTSVNMDKLSVVEISSGVEEIKGDPHVWLNPLNAKIELKNITDALIRLDKQNETYYRDNYDKYASEIEKLDDEYITRLSNCTHNEIVVTHNAFGYLCQRYGLSQVALQGVTNDGEPSMQKISETIKVIRDRGIKTIFAENAIDEKVMRTIAKETGSNILKLETLENITDKDIENGREYFSIMRCNLDALCVALD